MGKETGKSCQDLRSNHLKIIYKEEKLFFQKKITTRVDSKTVVSDELEHNHEKKKYSTVEIVSEMI